MELKQALHLATKLGLHRLNIAAEELAALVRWLAIDLRSSADVIGQLEAKSVVGNYQPPKNLIFAANDCLLYGEKNEVWLDYQAAYSANNVGNSNPRVTGANHLASAFSSVLSRSRRHRGLPLAASELQEALGTDYKFLPTNGGCEAIESAVLLAKLVWNRSPNFAARRKMIRQAGGHPKIVACRNNFHGRSSWAKAVSTNPAYRDPFAPNTLEDEIIWVDFGDARQVADVFSRYYVSVFVAEPIQCEGGMNVPPPDYFRQVKELCDAHGVILALDEVQTGLGRTGRMLCQEHYFGGKIEADVIALAKSLSGGQEVASGVLLRPEYADLIRVSEHGSTFGGNPKATATIRAAIRELQDRNLCNRAAVLGEAYLSILKSLCADLPDIVEVRGLGLAIGIEVKGHGADDICERLRHSPFTWRGRKFDGCWTCSTHGITEKTTVVRISPPLTVPAELLLISLYSVAQAVGHPNPESYRFRELEVPASADQLVNELFGEIRYYDRRLRRFVGELLESFGFPFGR